MPESFLHGADVFAQAVAALVIVTGTGGRTVVIQIHQMPDAAFGGAFHPVAAGLVFKGFNFHQWRRDRSDAPYQLTRATSSSDSTMMTRPFHRA